jgi:hypothetical protein
VQLEGFSPGEFLCPLLMDSHFPHACSTREYTPSLSHSPSAASPPSQGLGNMPDHEFSELCRWCWTLSRRKPLPSELSHLERATHRSDNNLFHHGPDNPLLQSVTAQFSQGKDNSTSTTFG